MNAMTTRKKQDLSYFVLPNGKLLGDCTKEEVEYFAELFARVAETINKVRGNPLVTFDTEDGGLSDFVLPNGKALCDCTNQEVIKFAKMLARVANTIPERPLTPIPL
jgi:hypothetical protein